MIDAGRIYIALPHFIKYKRVLVRKQLNVTLGPMVN